MDTTEPLRNGYLPGWPGRSAQMLTTGGTQLLHFESGENKTLKISDTYSVIIKAERRFNHLLGRIEKGWYNGNLRIFYPSFLYEVLGEAQKRVIECLNGENTGAYRALFDSYVRSRNCTEGKGKQKQSKNSL